MDGSYVALLSSGLQEDVGWGPALKNDQPFTFGFANRLWKRRPSGLLILAAATILVSGAAVLVYKEAFRGTPLPSASGPFPDLRTSNPDRSNAWLAYYEDSYRDFIATYNKVYSSPAERNKRFEIYARNMIYIETHNAQGHSFTLARNKFADLTSEEFADVHFNGYRPHSKGYLSEPVNDDGIHPESPDPLPESVNWVERGCVTPAKDQQKCGSCWAFSAVGATESAYCIKHGVLKSLSEQQLVDCGRPEGNHGCKGGDMDDAFQYMMDGAMMCTEDGYPYNANEGICHDRICKNTGIQVVRFVDVPHRNELALRAAVATHGPVSVAVQADQVAFQFYHSGVFDASCGKRLNHGVLLAGYATDNETGKHYWLVKNSWGGNWGENGFIKLSRDVGNKAGECGILLDASYPIVV